MELGVDRIKKVLCLFSNPQDLIPIIHITGTNGKGSVSAILSRMLALVPGCCVGVFHSPALMEPRDMIHLQGQPVTRTLYQEGLKEIHERVKEQNAQQTADASPLYLTDFELHTLLAYLLFSRHCDIGIVEVGLGGRLDATNVLKCPLAVLLTSVSLDHCSILGPTVQDILNHKLDLIRPGRPLIVSYQDMASKETILSMAQERGAHPIVFSKKSHFVESFAQDRFQRALFSSEQHAQASFEYTTQLVGPYQLINSALAIETILCLRDQVQGTIAACCPWKHHVRKLLEGLTMTVMKEALLTTVWPGRLEWLTLPAHMLSTKEKGNNLLLDGCHNPAGAAHLASYVYRYAAQNNVRQIHWIFALTLGKDCEGMADFLFFSSAQGSNVIPKTIIYTVQFETPSHMPWIKCYPSAELANVLLSLKERFAVSDERMKILIDDDLFSPLTKYYTADPETLWVITGSLYLVSDYYCKIK